ncbi:VOC family protein [Amnibacterium sp.]|uniref:VOC family protein n=1 Tax=Amnibacterium sp. TaxID=1872496 RepID=UPI00262BE9F6|nr:VOC family protein [Amnibacterium sp.]MCU1474680.1 glyoxalase [Amnibacterium sp.]
MALSIGAVVLRVRDLDREVAFWSAALDLVQRSAPEDDWVSLRPRAGHGVSLSFDLKRSEYALPPRFHLDLYADDRAAEVRRLVSLGATEIPLEHRGEVDWTLMADPEGNRFDVCDLPADGRSEPSAQ